ncbi:MAG: methyltransferase family protein [Candidatus Hodarchaeota archaeon]
MSEEPSQEPIDDLDKPLPVIVIVLIPVMVAGLFIVILFPISKDWLWIEGWLFIITFSINVGVSYGYLNKHCPRVLRNRMKAKKEGITAKTRESASSDKFILPLLVLGLAVTFTLTPLDKLHQWSSIPFVLEMVGLGITNLGSIIMFVVMVQNVFASQLLDINKEQKLIDTGLYAHVRHPQYTGAIILIIGIPISLGSWWAVIPAVFGAMSLIIRIQFEEEMLVKGMDGYYEYRTRVKYKLIPKVY